MTMVEDIWSRVFGRGYLVEEFWSRNFGRGILVEEFWSRNFGRGILVKDNLSMTFSQNGDYLCADPHMIRTVFVLVRRSVVTFLRT
jgi:hypothetical protein